MSFQIIYESILTLRCWQTAFLGEVPAVPLTVADASAAPTAFRQRFGLSPRQLSDYLNYDIRRYLNIRPTDRSLSALQQYGWRWLAGTQGGSLVASDAIAPPSGSSLQLAVSVNDYRFRERTDFDGPDADPGAADPDQEKEQIRGKLFYVTDQTVTGADHYLPTAATGLDERWFLPSYGHVFTLEKNSDGNEAIEIQNPLRANLLVKTLDYSEADPTDPAYAIDLTSLPTGIYRISGARIDDQLALIGFAAVPGLLGIIEMGIPSAGPIDLHFKEKQA